MSPNDSAVASTSTSLFSAEKSRKNHDIQKPSKKQFKQITINDINSEESESEGKYNVLLLMKFKYIPLAFLVVKLFSIL